MLLTWDSGSAEQEQESPLWLVVKARIAQLDGGSRSFVTITRGTSHLSFGGSVQSGLVVTAANDSQTQWHLRGENGADVVDLGTSIVAAECFWASGDLAPELRWAGESEATCVWNASPDEHWIRDERRNGPPLEEYVGLVWIGDIRGIRLRYMAHSLAEATALLVEEHGEGHVYTLYNETAAARLR